MHYSDFQELSDERRRTVGLESAPMAMFLLSPNDDVAPLAGWKSLEHRRYCQALMTARGGECIILEAGELASPAAARALCSKPLLPAPHGGESLVGFGIVAERESGAQMFSGMACLDVLGHDAVPSRHM